jgi:hypothetical protein
VKIARNNKELSMRRILFVISLITLPFLSFAATKKTEVKHEFVAGTEDVPLYQGFTAVAGGDVSYDSVDGRIIDATFTSNKAKSADVIAFYETTLPQLGWNKKESKLYERDGEALSLDIIEKKGKTLLKFSIRPEK